MVLPGLPFLFQLPSLTSAVLILNTAGALGETAEVSAGPGRPLMGNVTIKHNAVHVPKPTDPQTQPVS